MERLRKVLPGVIHRICKSYHQRYHHISLLKSRLQSHFCSGELWSILVVRLAHSANLVLTRLLILPDEARTERNVDVYQSCHCLINSPPDVSVLDSGDLTGTAMSPPLGRRHVPTRGRGRPALQ